MIKLIIALMFALLAVSAQDTNSTLEKYQRKPGLSILNDAHSEYLFGLTSACHVNKYTVDGDEKYTFTRLQDAIAQCPFDTIVVEKAETPYKASMCIKNRTLTIVSFSRAEIISANNIFVNSYVQLIGLVFIGPGDGEYPFFRSIESESDE